MGRRDRPVGYIEGPCIWGKGNRRMPENEPSKDERIASLKRNLERYGRRIGELNQSIELGQLPGPQLLSAAKEKVEEQKRQAEDELASLTK